MITVFGATGKLGAEIVKILRSRGASVRAVSREEGKLAQALALGAVGHVCDLLRPETLPAALESTRVLVITSNAILGRGANDLRRVDILGQAALVAAAQRQGVERVVFISAMGASSDHPVDLFRAKASTEACLEKSGLSAVVLAAAPFMETWLAPLAGQALRGQASALIGRGENPVPFVARTDVARVAVDAALASSATRVRRISVGGPERISLRQVVDLAGQLAGRPPTVRRRSPLWVRTRSLLLRSYDPVRARLLRTALWIEEAHHPPTPAEVLSRHGPFRSVRAFLESALAASG